MKYSNLITISVICPLDHWLFFPTICTLLQTKKIPFTISCVDSNKDLLVYKNKMARSVSDVQWNLLLKEREVIISMVRGINIVQMSINPNCFFLWEPKTGGEVMVISRDC
jgi:hypothetical protein